MDDMEGSLGGGILGGAQLLPFEGNDGKTGIWGGGQGFSGMLITPALGGGFLIGEAVGVVLEVGGGGREGGEGLAGGSTFCCTSGIPKPV